MANLGDQPLNAPLAEEAGGTDAISYTTGEVIYYTGTAMASTGLGMSSGNLDMKNHRVINTQAVDAYASADLVFKMSDAAGAQKISFQSSAPAEVGSIDSQGDAVFNSLSLTTALDETDGGTGLSTIAAGSALAANSADTITAVTSASGTKVLTNTDGTITWETGGGGSPAGANYQVQYYNGGSFGAEAAFDYNPSTNTLDVENVNLAAAGKVQVNSANPKRTIILTAGGGMAATTSGCATPTQVELGTNDVDLIVMDFDQTSIEYATWNITMPDNWDASTLTVWFYYLTSVTSGTVQFDLAARCFGDSDALDAAITGWSAGGTDTVPDAANDLAITASTTCTVTDAAAGEFMVVKVRRDTADTAAADVRLLQVKIEYGISAFSD